VYIWALFHTANSSIFVHENLPVPDTCCRLGSTAKMRIAIIGATGQTGLEAVKQALAANHTVTAVVRFVTAAGVGPFAFADLIGPQDSIQDDSDQREPEGCGGRHL
jgi:hypothetical protein